jgi:SHS2 domain-containing protein
VVIGEHPRGHALRAHTADLIVEAWGPTREVCIEQAVLGLVASFAQVANGASTSDVEVELTGGDADLLVAALDEVVYRLDADDAIPATVCVRPSAGGVTLVLSLVDRRWAEPIGAAPKGVSHSGLEFGASGDGMWRCRVTIDV